VFGGGWRTSGADVLGSSGDSGVELELGDGDGGVDVDNVRRPLKREIGRRMARRETANAIYLEISSGSEIKFGKLCKQEPIGI
jgi:hypothetical protein